LVKDPCTGGEALAGSIEGTDAVAEGGAGEFVEEVGVKGGLLVVFRALGV